MQGISTVASICVAIMVCIATTSGIGIIVPIIFLTSGLAFSVVCPELDGEVQGVSAGAAVMVSIMVCVCSSLGKGLSIPSVFLACGLVHGVVRSVVDG